ncbi:interleukin-7 receptor subunit alpha-like [Sinocyclocheilus anshuiensis]|uniref:Interleukin-7 receptor subunit alpha-like n=1 Tax=Sinocyclocheilus anshuiensis TaxID=1608454 RepID=A0A671R798_9TELE|nr:PREDICTED: interleukin-7 receptor subunit alpha-like [Sinocyclocheilus anshuiensis]
MAGVLWMLFVVSCPLVLSESGDFDWLDDVTCTSTMTVSQSNLICSLDEPPEEVKFMTLCKMEGLEKKCTNATKRPQDFIFENLIVTAKYELHIGNEVIKNVIDLSKMVKIPAPEMKLATYMEDTEEVFIWFEHIHEYVKNPEFQLEIWRDKIADKPIRPIIKYRNYSISRDRLVGDGVYYTRVRAKPWDFFAGDWSEWSSNATFTITSSTVPTTENNFPKIGFIITFFVILVLIIGLGTLRWRAHIKDYITPNIPHPKATLAQMQRGLPFTFSPEIFSDVFIHRVDYVDEKPSTELQDGLDECRYSQASSSRTSVSEMDMKADGCLPREQSHLKIRLLDESDLLKESEHGSSQSVTAAQRECKDEAYVTMSSLFKTQ